MVRKYPIDMNVQRSLSDPKIVQMMARHLGGEQHARKLALRVAHEAFVRPEITECDPVSVVSAVLTVAAEKLELGTEVYLIPRYDRRIGRKALTAQTSYKGELARVRRATGGAAIVRAAIVRAGDDFTWEPSDDRPIFHRVNHDLDFALGLGEIRDPVAAWAYIAEPEKNGVMRVHNPVVMSKTQLEAHRDQYVQKTKNGEIARDSIWNTDPDSAWLKTVVRKAAQLVGRGGLLHDLEDIQEPIEDQVVEALQPEPRPDHGPEAAHAAIDVAETILGTEKETSQ